MEKLSLLLLAVFTVLVCLAQPEIKFENTTYDFGKIKEEGGKVTGKFIFTNVGNQPLELTNVRPGCGCTAANYTIGAIAPGEQGYIEATYNPYNRPGAFNKNIRVTTNEPRFTENEKATPHMIFIKGEVIKRPPTEFEKAGYTKSTGMVRIKEPNVTHNLLKLSMTHSMSATSGQSPFPSSLTDLTNMSRKFTATSVQSLLPDKRVSSS